MMKTKWINMITNAYNTPITLIYIIGHHQTQMLTDSYCKQPIHNKKIYTNHITASGNVVNALEYFLQKLLSSLKL